jgi:hypothetical protein
MWLIFIEDSYFPKQSPLQNLRVWDITINIYLTIKEILFLHLNILLFLMKITTLVSKLWHS